MKRAQTEIMGLMIIVVIISIGMLFYLSYSTDELLSGGNVSDSIRKQFIDIELSQSFVQTLVRTTVPECENLPLDVLIKEAGLRSNSVDCGVAGVDLENYIEQSILSPLLEETLEKWGKSYYLLINYNNGEAPRSPLGSEDCKEGTLGLRPPGIQPIPYFPEPGTAFIELGICNN